MEILNEFIDIRKIVNQRKLFCLYIAHVFYIELYSQDMLKSTIFSDLSKSI